MSPEYLIIAAGILSLVGLFALQFIVNVLRRYQRVRRTYVQELQGREHRRRAPIADSTPRSIATDHEAKTADLDLV